MNTFKTIMIIILHWTWGIVQTLIGFIGWLAVWFFVSSSSRFIYKAQPVTSINGSWGGITLGYFTFVDSEVDYKLIAHEHGHTLQSIILGPLWLFVIGIPSLIWAGCFKNYRKKHNINYYSFYAEKWADKLGGVER